MMMTDQEPLDAITWFERMGRLLDGLGQDNGGPERHIRQAYHLHCLAPHPLKRMMADPVEEARMEAMLDCGAYESAVCTLIGPAGQITVGSGGTEPGIEVRMRVDPASLDGSGPDETWPIALLEAWAVSFMRLRTLPH